MVCLTTYILEKACRTSDRLYGDFMLKFGHLWVNLIQNVLCC